MEFLKEKTESALVSMHCSTTLWAEVEAHASTTVHASSSCINTSFTVYATDGIIGQMMTYDTGLRAMDGIIGTDDDL